MKNQKVAVVGMGAVSLNGTGVEHLFSNENIQLAENENQPKSIMMENLLLKILLYI
jgi:hypothetical protein